MPFFVIQIPYLVKYRIFFILYLSLTITCLSCTYYLSFSFISLYSPSYFLLPIGFPNLPFGDYFYVSLFLNSTSIRECSWIFNRYNSYINDFQFVFSYPLLFQNQRWIHHILKQPNSNCYS